MRQHVARVDHGPDFVIHRQIGQVQVGCPIRWRVGLGQREQQAQTIFRNRQLYRERHRRRRQIHRQSGDRVVIAHRVLVEGKVERAAHCGDRARGFAGVRVHGGKQVACRAERIAPGNRHTCIENLFPGGIQRRDGHRGDACQFVHLAREIDLGAGFEVGRIKHQIGRFRGNVIVNRAQFARHGDVSSAHVVQRKGHGDRHDRTAGIRHLVQLDRVFGRVNRIGHFLGRAADHHGQAGLVQGDIHHRLFAVRRAGKGKRITLGHGHGDRAVALFGQHQRGEVARHRAAFEC